MSIQNILEGDFILGCSLTNHRIKHSEINASVTARRFNQNSVFIN